MSFRHRQHCLEPARIVATSKRIRSTVFRGDEKDVAFDNSADGQSRPLRLPRSSAMRERTSQRLKSLSPRSNSAGIRPWGDGLIEAGEAYELIELALDKADAVIVLWSKSSIHSDGCATRRRAAATANVWCPSRWTAANHRSAFANITRSTCRNGTAGQTNPSLPPCSGVSKRWAGNRIWRRHLLTDDTAVATRRASRHRRRRSGGRRRRTARVAARPVGGDQARANSVAVVPFENCGR